MLRNSHLFLILFSIMVVLCCSDRDHLVNSQAEFILQPADLHSYEGNLDHAGLISAWDEQAFTRGERIYRTQCFQCHGDENQPGSLPNARKFWADSFKSGNNPYAMYQTLTRGLGQMPPQVNLVPRQKYDVIHFLRERFIRPSHPQSYFELTSTWLNALPGGDQTGPEAQPYHPWREMDYGNWLIHCYEIADKNDPPKTISGGRAPLANEDYREVNFAYKGIAMRLDSGAGGIANGNSFAIFDHDLLRFAGAWTGHGFIDWEDILLDDQHNVYPRTYGDLQAENPITPGWADPGTGTFGDPRIIGKDGRPFGPLPRAWAHYKGFYEVQNHIIIKYSVDQATVHEYYEVDTVSNQPVFIRTLNVSENRRPLKMRILPQQFPVKVISRNATLSIEDGYHILNIPANVTSSAKILFSNNENDLSELEISPEIDDLTELISGTTKETLPIVTSPIIPIKGKSAFDVDIFTLPLENPWKSRLRPTGIDFINGGKDALVCTIDGEVWKVIDIARPSGPVSWQRIATGLFQPLGIKYYDQQIYVGCRDQIVRLHDLNGDEKIDFYESFNSDHQVTEHFHEFAMGLQVDDEGNFYYAKSGRHARTSLVPQHGTLIKVSADGINSTIIANGFRAANGVCLNPDGSFFVTDQEGYWNPMNRINRVMPGGFYGNMWGYGAPVDSSDHAMEMPLCWIDMKYDRSPAELLWVESEKWAPLNGGLLSLSYGYGKIFSVLSQKIDHTFQGGIIELPLPQFPTGLIRGRFNHLDGQLYVCGMSAWATNQMLQTGGLYRVRYNSDKDLHFPIKVEFSDKYAKIYFTNPLDEKSALDKNNYQFNTWQLKRSRKYGSDRYDEKSLPIEEIRISSDGKILTLSIPDLEPTWIYEFIYNLNSKEMSPVSGALQGTIFELSPLDI
ncbi:MAG: c-type cytochrome [Saprospiraceae bacterium]|nr:c-type cytochrome [Saprospiraceae bacterium]